MWVVSLMPKIFTVRFKAISTLKKPAKITILLFTGHGVHGDWARTDVRQAIGNVYFGDNISRDFQQNVETKFFNHFLKEGGKGELDLPEAHMYDTGANTWDNFTEWPAKAATHKNHVPR